MTGRWGLIPDKCTDLRNDLTLALFLFWGFSGFLVQPFSLSSTFPFFSVATVVCFISWSALFSSVGTLVCSRRRPVPSFFPQRLLFALYVGLSETKDSCSVMCWMLILWSWRYLSFFVYKVLWQEVTFDNICDLVIKIHYRQFIATLQE